MKNRTVRVLFLLLGLLALSGQALAQDASQTIELIEVRGVLDPPLARFVEERIEDAGSDVEAIVLEMDTDASVAAIEPVIEAIRTSDVPVIAWVAPRGAVALTGAAQLARAADHVYVAPETRITLDRSTGEAASIGELLNVLDGQPPSIMTQGGGSAIETWDEATNTPSVRVRFQELPLWPRLLHAVTTPEVALALLLIGIYGFIFEAYNPGIGLALGVGAVCLALGIYALDVLPTNWLGILLVVVSTVLLLYDLHTGNLGPPTALGLVALVAGIVLSFNGAPEGLRLPIWFVFALLAGSLLFFISVMTAALRVRLRRPVTDEDGIVGSIAEATTDIAPEGTVVSNGRTWRARTMETGIAAGSKVEVKATEGLVLLVEPLHEHD